MSFCNPGFSPALQAAIDYAWAHDVVVVAATGNDGSSTATFPAGDRGVIGVSNTDQTDALDAVVATTAPDTFLGAPGTDIVTLAAGRRRPRRSPARRPLRPRSRPRPRCCAPGSPASNGVIVGRLARNAEAAGTAAETGNGRLNLARAIGDTGTASVTPAGAAPVGSGGPLVGPYVLAANNDANIAPGWRRRTRRDLQHALPQNDRRYGPALRITLPAGYTNISVAAAAFSSDLEHSGR